MVLLGAGGASTAIGAQGAIEGLKEIKLFNRRDEFFDKALAFAQRVNENTDCVVTVTDPPISKPLLKPRFRRHFNQWHKSGYETP